jgi:hypothetical protein
LGTRDPQTGNYIATAPSGGTRKATPLFNSGQSQDGTLKTSYTPDGRILLDAKNRKSAKQRLVQEEEVRRSPNLILTFDTDSFGAFLSAQLSPSDLTALSLWVSMLDSLE